MPIFEIEDPTTNRTIEIEGDSPPTEEELEQVFSSLASQEQGQQAPPIPGNSIPEEEFTGEDTQPDNTFLGTLDKLSNQFSQFTAEVINTGTFGLGDIVAGAGQALAEELFGGEDKDPARAFNVPREERLKFREENPVSSGVASFVGGFINPASGPAGKFVANAPGFAAKTAKSGLVGAGFAGGQATGEVAGEALGASLEGGEFDINKGLDRIGGSTAIGAGIGTALPPAIKGLGFAGKQIVDFVRRFSQKGQATRALRKVAEALERDGFTPQQALERINKLGPEAALIDAGENSRALGFAISGIPGKGKTAVTKFLRNRQEGIRNPQTGVIEGGQVNRIQDHIDQLVKANFFTEAQRLANMNNAAKLYQNAYRSNPQIDSRAVNRILKTPSGRKAFKMARNTLQDLRKNLSKTDPELTDQLRKTGGQATGKGVGKGLKLEFLDQVKQELFDLEQAAKTQFGKSTSKSLAISKLRRDFTKALDDVDVTGDYARARLAAGDKLANQEALESGSKFLSKAEFSSPEELGVALEDMTPEARHLFRVGAAQSLKGKLADVVSRADATKKLIDIQSLERKIKLSFGDNKKFQQYVDLLENEKELFRAVTEALGNSKTAARGEALADFSRDTGKLAQGVRDILAGDFFSGTKNILGGAKDRLTFTSKESEVVGKLLTGKNIKGLAEQVPEPVTRLSESLAPLDLEQGLTRALSSTAGSRQE